VKDHADDIAATLKGRLAVEADSLEFFPSRKRPQTPAGRAVEDGGGIRHEDLVSLQKAVSDCTLCGLSKSRRNTVFGEGMVGCDVMFVGEAPGADEDASGRPFVGKAGKLLDRMISAMGLKRSESYIANVLKCRPPGNATPTHEQADVCMPYLERQRDLIRPRFVVALGRAASEALSGRTETIARMRGRWHKWGDTPFVVTYHPAALLRDPSRKRLAWEDLQKVMARLDLKSMN